MIIKWRKISNELFDLREGVDLDINCSTKKMFDKGKMTICKFMGRGMKRKERKKCRVRLGERENEVRFGVFVWNGTF